MSVAACFPAAAAAIVIINNNKITMTGIMNITTRARDRYRKAETPLKGLGAKPGKPGPAFSRMRPQKA
jgi:hypothetical protein